MQTGGVGLLIPIGFYYGIGFVVKYSHGHNTPETHVMSSRIGDGGCGLSWAGNISHAVERDGTNGTVRQSGIMVSYGDGTNGYQ
jgi:hypothetical protein